MLLRTKKMKCEDCKYRKLTKIQYNNIKYSLIQSLYDFLFPLPKYPYPTGKQCNERLQKAYDYYLCIRQEKSYECAKFNRLINIQMQLIIKEIEKELS